MNLCVACIYRPPRNPYRTCDDCRHVADKMGLSICVSYLHEGRRFVPSSEMSRGRKSWCRACRNPLHAGLGASEAEREPEDLGTTFHRMALRLIAGRPL